MILIFLYALNDAKKLSRCRLSTQELIVNGKPYNNQVPWQIVLRIDKKVTCSGFIATDEWIITSAQYTHKMDANQIEIIIGTYNISKIKSQNIYEAKEVIIHPLFSPFFSTKGFDVSLIKLKRPIELEK